MQTPKIMTIYGTRPEAVKVAPLIKAIEIDQQLESVTVTTGQHREMLDQVNELFEITPDHDLDVFAPGQELNALMSKVFDRIDSILVEEEPSAVVVQGDTSTVAAASLAAFYRQIPVVHLEAGLRSGDIFSPFPEEANRKITGQVASLHLAPTDVSKENLLRENMDEDRIVITGNTVIDALLYTVAIPVEFADEALREAATSTDPIILVTTHRRENWGEPMEQIGRALRRIAETHSQYTIVLPLHLNPKVRSSIIPALEDLGNVVITEPLDYREFTALVNRAEFVITDSGGVQEEAPSLGKPVLVLRENTERPEAVTAGTVKLIGTDEERIVTEATRLIEDRDFFNEMAQAVNPYGDGQAAARAVAAIKHLLGLGQRREDFSA